MKKQIEAIDDVQRRATQQVTRLSTLTYEERKLKLPTLSYRRSRGDMKLPTLSYRRSRGDMKLPTLSYRRSRGDKIEMYKILTGKYDDDVSTFITPSNDSYTRGHHLKLYKSRSRLDIRKYTFT